jgi:predicted small integral membrane protein
MIDLSWMAWTWPTVAFFVTVVLSIVVMGIWEKFSPGGNPLVAGQRLYQPGLAGFFWCPVVGCAGADDCLVRFCIQEGLRKVCNSTAR